MRRKQIIFVAACGLLASAAACSNNEQAQDPQMVAKSTRGNLRFKGPERLNTDLAAALELTPDAVCTELGQYQCTAAVHTVALGGVDPYGTGLYEPSGVTSLTTPLVVDRVVWSACSKRVDTDLGTPASAVIFRNLPLSGAKLANPDGDEVRAAVTELTQRGLQRDPTASEVDLPAEFRFTGADWKLVGLRPRL